MSWLIIGIGNEYRSDDSVGLIIADKLAESTSEDCVIRKAAGEGIALLNLWEDFSKVIIIDAVKSDADAGTIQRIDLANYQLEKDWFQSSSHLFALPEAYDLAKALGKLPDKMIVYGIEGKSFDYGTDLSFEVEKSLNLIVDQIKSEISK